MADAPERLQPRHDERLKSRPEQHWRKHISRICPSCSLPVTLCGGRRQMDPHGHRRGLHDWGLRNRVWSEDIGAVCKELCDEWLIVC